MTELISRFLIGGLVVTLFAIIGDVLRPKSFAGLFGAAPSIALVTLGLTIARNGSQHAATESRSMILGAVEGLDRWGDSHQRHVQCDGRPAVSVSGDAEGNVCHGWSRGRA